MFKNIDKLTKGEQFIVEWQYRTLGSFQTSLAETMCRADDNNLNKLAKGFPEEVEAYQKYTKEVGWWENVREFAMGRKNSK